MKNVVEKMEFDFNGILFALSYALDCVEHDLLGVTSNHGKRVAAIAMCIGNRMGVLTHDEERQILSACAVMHDCALSEYIQDEFDGSYVAATDSSLHNFGKHCLMGEEAMKEALLTYLNEDQEISQHVMYQNGYIQVENPEGEWEYLRVSSGDETVFPLSYLEGGIPSQESGSKEIALSHMEAEELKKKVGDKISVKAVGENSAQSATEYTVSGIYQDITYGGKTGKAQIEFAGQAVEGYVFYLRVQDGVSIADKTETIRAIVSGGRVTPITEFMKQTLGGVIEHLGTMVITATALSLFLVILISTMFLQLVTAKEHSAIAIKKAMGFTNRDVRIQFGIRILVIQIIAIIMGTILTNTVGEVLFGAMMSTMGTTKITMLTNPLISYAASPLLQVLVCIVTVVSATKVVQKYHIRDQITE